MQSRSNKTGTFVRIKAVEVLELLETSNFFAETAIDNCIRHNAFTDERDKNLLNAIVFGVLRERGSLDWLIARLYRGNFNKLESPIKNILRCALYQFRALERIPVFAVCDEAAHTAHRLAPRGVALVNGICREFLRQRKNILMPTGAIVAVAAAALSHPPWLVEEMLKSHDEAAVRAMCTANNSPPSIFLRANLLKTTRENLQGRLAAKGIQTSSTHFSPVGLSVDKAAIAPQKTESFSDGLFVIQDEASQLIPYLLSAQPSERVLDLCAGRGIKATQLAALMENRGFLLASDIIPGKLKELAALALKMGATNIKAALVQEFLPVLFNQEGQREGQKGLAVAALQRQPAAKPPATRTQGAPKLARHNLEPPKLEISKLAAPVCQASFDKILVDAPCSGTGVIRRHPEIKWRLRAQDLPELAATQKRLLAQAASLLKVGGRLVYATCSVLSVENEEVVGDFLEHNPNYTLEKIADERWRELVDEQGFFKTPPRRLDKSDKLNVNMDGFFAACLRKDRQ